MVQPAIERFEQLAPFIVSAAATPSESVLKAVGNFNAKTSQEVLAPILTANPDIELVYCHNDDNAIGTLNAVLDVKKERGAPFDPKRVLIVGMDGNKTATAQLRWVGGTPD